MNLKQKIYINVGLNDSFKCSYYRQKGNSFFAYIDSNKCANANLPVFGLNFKDEKAATYFMTSNIRYDEYEFDVFVHGNVIIIDPRTIDGKLEISCEQNEEMAKKIVKRFRTQYVERLNREIQSDKDSKKDFKGMQF